MPEAAITVESVMDKLEAMGTEQTRRTYRRHGAPDSMFGVKAGDMKKLVRDVKRNQPVAKALYDTGNSDAMYLAGLSVDPKTAGKDMLREWARSASWYMLAEYTVAGVAAESPYALELAREWMRSADEMVAVCGWSTYANYLTIAPDAALDLEEIRSLLAEAEQRIHGERNRVRYTMNTFVIVVGAYIMPLHKEAAAAAERIGKVHVNMGETACKVPPAADYIRKVEQAGKLGVKKKTCIC